MKDVPLRHTEFIYSKREQNDIDAMHMSLRQMRQFKNMNSLLGLMFGLGIPFAILDKTNVQFTYLLC